MRVTLESAEALSKEETVWQAGPMRTVAIPGTGPPSSVTSVMAAVPVVVDAGVTGTVVHVGSVVACGTGGVGVLVAVAVAVPVAVEVGALLMAVSVTVGVVVLVAVDVLADVAVTEPDAVEVAVLVGVSVGVLVGVSVGVLVGVFVGVSVGVSVGVLVGVFVGVSVGVLVGVLVGKSSARDEDGSVVVANEMIASTRITSEKMVRMRVLAIIPENPPACFCSLR